MSFADYSLGYRCGAARAEHKAKGLASFRAIQATVNLLLVASGRYPEKKALDSRTP